jgi:hypothetical protein
VFGIIKGPLRRSKGGVTGLNSITNRPLTKDTLNDINCVPGGLEIRGKGLKGDLGATLRWHLDMLEEGMKGFVSYSGDEPRGFVEYMSAELAPFPIIGPGAAVLICFHWEPLNSEDPDEHLDQERRLIRLAIEATKDEYSGLAVIGWPNPVHYPVELFNRMGFERVSEEGYLTLMWLPFSPDSRQPEFAPLTFVPRDRSDEGLVQVDFAWSTRCPYDVHHHTRIAQAVSELHSDRLRFCEFRLDSRKQVLKYRTPNLNWQWLYVNGEEVEIPQLTSEGLQNRLRERRERAAGNGTR